ncbi:MAG: MBL fold metallo-hydrolase, partial [Candidatus Aenigmatarchaeota archaeon]
FAGLFGLLETMSLEQRTQTLRIFAPEAEQFVSAIEDFGYSSKPFKILPVNVEYIGHDVEVLVDEEEYQIVAMPADHGVPAVAYAFVEKDRVKIDKDKAAALGLPAKGPLYNKLKQSGFVIFKDKKIKLEDLSVVEKGKRIVYSGDTRPCQNVLQLSMNANLLIHDSTYFEEFERKHATFKDVLQIAKEAGVKSVVLTHISRRYQDESKLKELVEKFPSVKIARDFMKIVV